MDVKLSNAAHQIPVIDLFAGPGGLGEGFSAFNLGDRTRFQIALSIEKDAIARETLKLRSFFRKCTSSERLTYYDVLKAGMPVSELYTQHPAIAAEADREAWCIALGEENSELIHSRIEQELAGACSWVLIGGPPCQAYSLVGRSRNRGNLEYRPENDNRHTLYREYLEVIARHHPTVFVMENVKGLLSSKVNNELIFNQILADLKNPIGSLKYRNFDSKNCPEYRLYSLVGDSLEAVKPQDFVLKMEDYGIPQARHRIIIIGVRKDVNFKFEPLIPGTASVIEVLKDLPRLRSGISKASDGDPEWHELMQSVKSTSWYSSLQETMLEVYCEIETTLQNLSGFRHGRGAEFLPASISTTKRPMNDWYIDEKVGGIYNHSTRSHIKEDLYRYLFAVCFAKCNGRSPKLPDFPDELMPNHKNARASIFEDRFRVQISSRPSTTVTSHISKDGHYYIHYDPSQCRSLTVREAARLQTFPDNYFFCGPRTEQYKQVGNAVPPLLALEIARIVSEILN